MVPAESASLVFPIDVIHLAGNMPDFTTSSPIGPVSGHLSLHMRKHAVDMVNLVCRLVLPRWLVVRALVVTVFLLLRESRNASQTQPQHNDYYQFLHSELHLFAEFDVTGRCSFEALCAKLAKLGQKIAEGFKTGDV